MRCLWNRRLFNLSTFPKISISLAFNLASLLLTYLKNLRRSGKCETPRSSKIDVYLLEVKCFQIFVLVTFMPSRNVELQLACLPTLLCGYSDNVWINSCGEEGTAWKNGQGFKFYLGGHKGMDQSLCWLTSRRGHWLGRPIVSCVADMSNTFRLIICVVVSSNENALWSCLLRLFY